MEQTTDQPIELSSLSILDIRQAIDLLDMVPIGIEKADYRDVLDRIERSLARDLTSDFAAAARDGVKAGIKDMLGDAGTINEDDVDTVMNAIDKEMAAFAKSPDLVKRVGRGASSAYKTSRKGFANEIGIGADFNLVDKETQINLAKTQTWWVGNHYDQNLREDILETVDQTLITEGLGRREAGIALAGKLVKKLGVAANLPYFEGLAATVRGQAQSFASIESMVQAKVQRYEIIAVMDARTSDICRQLNGTIFEVPQGVALRDQLNRTKTPLGVKRVMPWIKVPQFKSITGDKTGDAKIQALVEHGLQLPPYHPHCRTVVEMVP